MDWIDASTTLPPENVLVLACTARLNTAGHARKPGEYRYKLMLRRGTIWHAHPNLAMRAAAPSFWMHLAEPPKAEVIA